MRSKNALLNMISSVAGYVIVDVFNFILRIIFVKSLGENYLGINGLFTEILTILSISELGISTAIIHRLYRPIAENDVEKIKSFMHLYKMSYYFIGLIIVMLGICILPFLTVFIKDVPDIPENIYLLFLFFLFNTTISYFYSYKTSLIIANQKLSIVNLFTSVIRITIIICQGIVLLITKNYIFYLFLMITGTLLTNIINSKICDKMYPYLKETSKKLDKCEIKGLISDIKNVFLFKVSDSIVNGTDNIMISSLINIATVGIYSNYMLILNAIKQILYMISESMIAGFGNLSVTSEKKKVRKIFELNNFVTFWLCAMMCSFFYCTFPLLIPFFFGEGLVLDDLTIIMILFLFYIVGLLLPVSNYRYAVGLFKYGRIRAVLTPIANIVLSIIFSQYMGISGLFLGTIVGRVITQVWYDPYIVYKYDFEYPVRFFYINNIIYIILCLVCCGISAYFCKFIQNVNIINIIIRSFISIIIPNILFILIFFKSKKFKLLRQYASTLILNFIKKGENNYDRSL